MGAHSSPAWQAGAVKTRDWETTERVLDSGAYESRQRVLVDAPAVEASEAGARALGIAYWRTVGQFTRGGIRASWTGSGGRLKLMGVLGLLTFGPAELEAGEGLVSCRHAVSGGLLTLRAGGSVTLAQRAVAGGHELSVTVEEYLPRLGGILYAKGQSPFHEAVSRRYFRLLTREASG
jgi:hypothetical protein